MWNAAYDKSLQSCDDGGGGVETDAIDENSGSDTGDETSGAAERGPQPGDQSVHRRVWKREGVKKGNPFAML